MNNTNKSTGKGFAIFFGVIILISIIPSLFTFVFGGIREKIQERRDSKEFTILSNPDNAAFDEEIYEFGKKNDIKITIVHADDLEAIDLLEADSTRYDAVWLSNSTWLYMLNGVTMLNSKSININPVVLGIKKSKATSLGFVNKDVYNKDIVNAIKDGKLKYVMTSVTKTNTGLVAYLGILNSLAGSPEILTSNMLRDERLKEDLTTFFKGVERVSGTDDFLREMFLNSTDYEAAIATESSLISINKELVSNNREPLYLIYPIDGVSLNDSPFAYIDNSQNKLDNFNLIQTFLLSKESQDKLEKLGKRTWYGGVKVDSDTTSFKKEWGIDTSKYLIPLKYPSKDVMNEAISLYISAIRKPSVTVFCLDYSGSMYGTGEEQLEDAMDFILDEQKAMEELIQFSEKDKIYVIPFSGNNINTYNATGKDTNSLINKIRSLYPGGGTNIYGCASEAVKILNKESDDYTKTVILMTDGESNSGSFANFSSDYSYYGKNIPVYSIMFGSAKAKQLEEIAAYTNAKVFDGRSNLLEAFKEVRSYN